MPKLWAYAVRICKECIKRKQRIPTRLGERYEIMHDERQIVIMRDAATIAIARNLTRRLREWATTAQPNTRSKDRAVITRAEIEAMENQEREGWPENTARVDMGNVAEKAGLKPQGPIYCGSFNAEGRFVPDGGKKVSGWMTPLPANRRD